MFARLWILQDVAAVVNYDMPTNIEQYTHRIGETRDLQPC